MKPNEYSRPFELTDIHVTDEFWKNEIELVRKEVIPYQWNALNDKVEGAAPSFCMRNFKVAARMNEIKKERGKSYVAPTFTFRGFEALPEDPNNPEPDKFYGFVFQDTDFSKWIEAVAYSLTQYEDKELEAVADSAIDIVCAAQQEDGYLDTYYIINGRDKTFTNLRDHHELYCFGHLTEGAVAYYKATGKDKLLKAAERFADYIDSYFGPEDGKCKGYPGHEIAEMALIRLYEATGNKKYFELSKFFIDVRGSRPYYFDSEEHADNKVTDENQEKYHYHQAHKPVREQDEAVGHAVRAVYLYSGMADVARISGDEQLYEACLKIWDSIVNRKMYITGGIGGTHLGEAFSFDYDLPNDTAYSETCAAIGLVFFARRMLEIKADSRFADVMERALYNGVLSGMALDGKSFFYVNPLEVNPKACYKDERKFHVKPVRQKWFGCACCPPNIARLVSSIGSYAYTHNDDTIFVHLYMGAKVEKKLNNKNISMEIQSGFPWDGNVKILINGCNEKFRLALRIPEWCDGVYSISGIEDAGTEIKDGYLYIDKVFKEDEVITLAFEMTAQFISSNDNVRENAGNLAVSRGPIVYAMESVDNGANLHQIYIDGDGTIDAFMGDICKNKCVMLTAKGERRLESDKAVGLYHRRADKTILPCSIKLVPYYMWANRGENEMSVWIKEK